jgi:hypothetical protein
MQRALFEAYLKALAQVVQAGDAREESFYPSLARLIEDDARAMGRTQIQVTIQPTPTEGGNPDFRVWDGRHHIVGYIEAKPPTEEVLDRIEHSEQLKRYRETFPNLILTNFLEFRLYRDGQRVGVARLGREYALTQLNLPPPLEGGEAVWTLLEQFLDFRLPKPRSAEELARELAKRTRFLRDIIRQQLHEEQVLGKGTLLGFYEAFQKFLIGDLTPDQFADLFAQTITYGLFAARTRTPNGFSRQVAFERIPPTVGVLRDLFRYISLGNLPEQMTWIVDDIAEVLAVADVADMMSRYYREGKGSDPIVHFYETFLAAYDPQERERRGVYYTPDPVVSYIVRSLHHLLQQKFGMPDGLASRDVTLLDPAAGTMTFVARAAELAVREFEQRYGSGAREAFIREHILRNFYAFELMVAPYAVGHLKMGFFLEELGHRLEENERIPFYLTNTLDMSQLQESSLPGLSSLAEESHRALEVKGKIPILVILGNPPYSGHSANREQWIQEQIELYKQVDGKPLGEKNPKWLQDDYVKFIRFAQWKIERAGRGIVGVITNHSYLDNPTFRGMRRSLMHTFDEIYVLDLHGNSLKRERCPDGSPDENVFDIRQGVAIAFFIKTGRSDTTRVHHAERWGRREEKYTWLTNNDWHTTPWQPLEPKPELYLFVPRDESELERYEKFAQVTEIFPLHGVGMTTARDEFVIDMDKQALINRIRSFKNYKGTDEELHMVFRIRKKQGWSIRRAWQMLQDVPDSELEQFAVPVLYRPFDVRWIFYHDAVVWRTVRRVMRHMLAGENVALVFVRQVKASNSWQHCLVSNYIGESSLVSNKTSEIGYLAPLYLYPETERRDLFSGSAGRERVANLNPQLLEALAEAYGARPSPEEVFDYIYAVLYAPTYRERYADFLRLDFPRVPFPSDGAVFQAMAQLGAQLGALHLLRAEELNPPRARFEGQGDNRVGSSGRDRLRYEGGRVYINATQYFEPVPQAVWEYTIGGYRVCEKWLKERQGRQLSLEEIRTYLRIVTALGYTLELQAQIDALYPQVEASLLPLTLGQAGTI